MADAKTSHSFKRNLYSFVEAVRFQILKCLEEKQLSKPNILWSYKENVVDIGLNKDA